jgi:glycosyltransferase involved in cell wall biosynthesis
MTAEVEDMLTVENAVLAPGTTEGGVAPELSLRAASATAVATEREARNTEARARSGGHRREHVLLIEPCHTELGHASFNRAFAAMIREAFPAAKIVFACAPGYRDSLASQSSERRIADAWIDAEAWSHPNFSWLECWKRYRWLAGVIGRMRRLHSEPSHVVVLGSSGPLLLAMFATRALLLKRACRMLAVLHGNANEIVHGWRPRNPMRRAASFRSALALLRVSRVELIALEAWIAGKLRSALPRHAESITFIPHGVDADERLPAAIRSDSRLRVLFVGQATPYKGFAEFVRLATLAIPGDELEFRAVGSIRPDVRSIDQSALARRASERGVSRAEMLDEIAHGDLVFMWQSEHYALSPSGVLLDCVNLGIPMVGRRNLGIEEIERRYGPVGLFAPDLDALLPALARLRNPALRQRLVGRWKANLARARQDRLPQALAAVARGVLRS